MTEEICIECGRKWIGHKVPDEVTGCLVCPWCMEKELPMSHKMSGEPLEGGKCWETNSDFRRKKCELCGFTHNGSDDAIEYHKGQCVKDKNAQIRDPLCIGERSIENRSK